jgi:hypothetical protein
MLGNVDVLFSCLDAILEPAVHSAQLPTAHEVAELSRVLHDLLQAAAEEHVQLSEAQQQSAGVSVLCSRMFDVHKQLTGPQQLRALEMLAALTKAGCECHRGSAAACLARVNACTALLLL